MARHQRSFNTSRRSKAQKRALRETVAQRQRNILDAKITHSAGAISHIRQRGNNSRSKPCSKICIGHQLQTENEELRRRLHNMQRQFRRARKARDKTRRVSRGSPDDSAPSLGDIMLCTASSSPPSESLTPHASSAVWAALRQAIVNLRKQNDALRKRLSRQVKSSSREIKRAVQKAKVSAVMTYVVKDKGQITSHARALIRSLVDIGIPFSSLLDVISCVLMSAGIEVKGKFSEHSVHRIVLEGGVYARLQIVDEIQHTKSLTISGDGTSFRNINLEAGFMLYKPPGSETPQLRTLPLIAATSHTSEAQLKGWQGRFNGFCTLWNSSPLIQGEGPVSINSILSKTKGMSSDHANDQKSLAALFEKWKAQVDREARGQEAVMSMTAVELLTLQIEVMNTCLAQVGGYPGWDALPASEKQTRNVAAHREAMSQLGEDRYNALTPEERRWTDLFIWAGCGMHKEMNAVKWGTKYMEAFWVSETAKELDAPPPIFLFNRDNAAAVADKTATTAKARAEQVSSHGAIKTASLAGAIFRNKYEKKGQQDAYRYFFSEMLGFIVQFPDTSNTRYGSFCDAACELLVNLVIYLEFLNLMRYNKEKGELNHMEQNVFDALHDPSTLTELAVLSLYSQNISQPYAAFIRDTSRNALDLGDYHSSIIQHCQSIIENPELLLTTESDSYRMATLDGAMWQRPEAVYTVQRLYQTGQLPFLRHALISFFKGAIHGWTRFTTEFAPGGRIDLATEDERSAAFMRPTNCHSEGALGSYVVTKRHTPSMSLPIWNAKTMHKQNGTAAWITARDTPELGLFVSRVAREEDDGHLNKEMRRDQIDYRKDRAENKKQELAEKLERRKALSSKREAIEVHLEAKYWKDLLISRSATLVQIKAQLSWLRAPERKLLVTVPPGLSNGKKDHILIGLITILEGLDATKISALYDTRILDNSGPVNISTSQDISEGEDSSVSEEEG